MKYKLIATPKNNVLDTILTNRGVKLEDVQKFMNVSKNNTFHYSYLFSDDEGSNFIHGRSIIDFAVRNRKAIYIIVDCDCDGFTSASELGNYLYDLYGEDFEEVCHYVFHDGKEHGIELDKLPKDSDFILIVPDAGTNDVKQCEELYKRNIPVLILDHHDIDYENPYCILINNQIEKYPNKEISGVCVVYKFLQYLDDYYGKQFADNYLDLVSLGMIADMMCINNSETRYFVQAGCSNIINPFIKEHIEINKKRMKTVNPVSLGFYVSPYVNAMCRSGELDEKEILFNSFLNYKAYSIIKSSKKGEVGNNTILCKEGELVATRVKRRQEEFKKKILPLLNDKIVANELDKNSVIIILNDDVDCKNIAGLICNELTHKYQRPVCCLSSVNENYEGSSRGNTLCGVDDFKKFCLESQYSNWCKGHPNAFGISLSKSSITEFINYANEKIEITEPTYFVDYILSETCQDKDIIKEIVDIGEIWGNGLNEPLVCLKDIPVSFYCKQIFEKKLDDDRIYKTMKIKLKNNVEIMKFDITKEEEMMLPDFHNPVVKMDFIGRCNRNIFRGQTTYQIFCEDMSFSQKVEEVPFKFTF